jgi:hypothetical protein
MPVPKSRFLWEINAFRNSSAQPQSHAIWFHVRLFLESPQVAQRLLPLPKQPGCGNRHLLSPVTLFCWFGAFFRSRRSLGLEILALRQQVSALKRQNPRPRLSTLDQGSWVLLRRGWSRWAEMLVVVARDTAVRWYHEGFWHYERFLSRRTGRGRPRVPPELRELIQRIPVEDPTCGAPRIHAELLRLGCEISGRTVSRLLARVGRNGDARRCCLTLS